MDVEVSKRQTTYWELREHKEIIRVGFVGKEEFRCVDSLPSSFSIVESHPILMDYEFAWEKIYLGSPVLAAADVRNRLACAISLLSDGWRVADSYFNDFGVERILHDGYGLLLSAPVPVVECCRTVLEDVGARISSMPERPPRWPRKALLLGKNYVIARDFRVAKVT